MFMEERKEKILAYIKNQTRATVHDLTSYFQVSESTIRRDLKELEESNHIKRTHGGAVLAQSVSYEQTMLEKEKEFVEEKQAIARKAVTFIEPGDTILLDSGTTTYELSKELKSLPKLSIVTNSVAIMQELAKNPSHDVMLLGGSFRRETSALVGPFAEQSLKMIRIDKAFIGINGIDLKEGILTTPNLMEATIKRLMIERARQSILLSDHSKVNKVNFAKVADLNDINDYIFDELPLDVTERIESYGVNVHLI
ncbi:DeoR/GlpR family DNA-binding transcription regulator [Aquibacillus salsiterrae]|uniref:DeoR/GlpR family DNA-binding transcription regulator n=1 Tax=Aquibacillus salsiterrae TaxID=2950439 RepID=A0A9X4AEY2_9BACI|nr:DeoR/GlpR family DNA-binding transcription regulator [Aquibacillus salsiterrae]MDC3417427.1 DeoR/GlpR family DNA-binding transcription regulator [Aquibacillus salsiterrae]